MKNKIIYMFLTSMVLMSGCNKNTSSSISSSSPSFTSSSSTPSLKKSIGNIVVGNIRVQFGTYNLKIYYQYEKSKISSNPYFADFDNLVFDSIFDL